jgi:outer membrane lipoprotein SlyB
MRGTIVSEDIVDIEKDRGIGAGAAIGGAAGALAGSAFGKGEGKILTTAAGALLGGTAGHFAQRSKNYKCVRYVIKLDNRNTICIVQGLDDTGMIPVGTRVYVTIDSAGKGKVFPMDR